MSTSNKRRRTSDPAHHTGRSVAESHSFMEAILSHPILLQTLKTQEILQLRLVCKAWRNLYSSNGIIRAIGKARNQDGTRDWFFPVLVNVTSERKNSAGSWSGIWHEHAHDHTSELKMVHSFLPPLLQLPGKWTFPGDYSNDIVACAGGLLLIRTLPGIVSVPRSSALNPKAAGTSDCYHLRHAGLYWEPLLVVNPLTKEFLELPVADCSEGEDISPKLFHGVQAHMLVDEMSATYRIILTFRTFVCVYTSSCNSWRISRFTEPGPWGGPRVYDLPWALHVCASVHWRGRLLFADIELQQIPNVRPNRLALRVFEVDFEAGGWKFHTVRDIPRLRWHDNFAHCLLRDITYGLVGTDYTRRIRILRYLELVECSGEIFVVVPARLDRRLEVGAAVLQRLRPEYYELVRHHFDAELQYMPLQFYIFQLQGPSLLHGALRIRLPRSRTDLRSRWDALARVLLQDHPPNRHWMSCHASGNLIWVSCEDYLLQYDAATGQSKTQIIPVNENDHKLKVSYRPSFHMKP